MDLDATFRPFVVAGFVIIILVVLAAGIVTFALLAMRSRTEEEKLLERFGGPYRAYRSRTGRFLPRVARASD